MPHPQTRRTRDGSQASDNMASKPFLGQNTNYTTERVPALGGWNADVNEAARPASDFDQVLNLRMTRPGTLTVRSGYREHVVEGTRIPVTKAEYRLLDEFRDITFYTYNGSLHALILETQSETGSFEDVRLCEAPTECIVGAAQFNTFMIFTVYGQGVYALWPSAAAMTGWQVRLLGKDTLTTPRLLTPADTTTGDLYIYSATNKTPNFSSGDDFERDDQGKIIELQTNLDATYYSMRSRIGEGPLWQPNKEDVPYNLTPSAAHAYADDPDTFSPHHLAHNGWGYVAVPIYQLTDPLGQKLTFEGLPSTDFWMRDWYFMPAHLTPPPHQYYPWTDQSRWVNSESPNAEHDILEAFMPFSVNTQVYYWPDRDAYYALQGKYRAWFNDQIRETEDPYYFTAFYLGWRNQVTVGKGNPRDFGVEFERHPYAVSVLASKLKKAPMTNFTFEMFGVPEGTIQVDIYRTAYSQPDEKENVSKSPLYGRIKYGRVGSVKPGETWVDDVPDTEIDFGKTPQDLNGYQRGQMSGQCLRIFDDHLVLGNTKNSTWLLDPTQAVQSFWCQGGRNTRFPSSVNFYVNADTERVAPDGFPDILFHYSYANDKGQESNASRILTDLGTLYDKRWAAFLFPRGYTSGISSINLYRSRWNYTDNTRHFYRILSQSAKTQRYVSENTEDAVEVFVAMDSNGTLLTRTVESSRDPGAAIWSEPNDMLDWPKKNFQIQHQYAPITFMETTLGPLYVFTDQSVTKTDLQGRFEEDQKRLGNIGLHTAIKNDKVVVHLTSNGLYVTEGSGQRLVRGQVHTEVLKYLREVIPDQPPLANARRATIGLLGQGRNEVWLHFPSSEDLHPLITRGTALPARTFVYQESSAGTMEQFVNYEFNVSENEPRLKFLMCSHSSGRLFSAHYDPDRNLLVVQNNDTDAPWPGMTALEKTWGMEPRNNVKRLHQLAWLAKKRCQMFVITGARYELGDPNSMNGKVNSFARSFSVNSPTAEDATTLVHKIAGSTIETTARKPVTRWVTNPGQDGKHEVEYHAIELSYTVRR